MTSKNLKEYTMAKASYKGRRRKPGAARRVICGISAGITFLLVMGLVGGLERGTLAFNTGAILILLGTILFAGLIWGAGALNSEG